MKLLLAFGFLSTSHLVLAATYHVSAERGDDTRSTSQAETEGTPWKSMGHAAAQMKAGDTAVLHAGTYRETVKPMADQLTFVAAPGEVPVVSGCDVISTWKKADAIHQATVTTRVRAVFVAGEHQQLARWPNENGNPLDTIEWAACEARNEGGKAGPWATVTFSGTSWKPDHWVGGHFLGYHGHNYYQANQGRITQSGADQLSITDLSGNLKDGLDEFEGEGRGYIINHLNALDAPGEWYWGNGVLHFMPPANASGEIEAQTRLYGFDLTGRKKITLRGIRFIACSALLDLAEDCEIDGCAFIHHAPWGNHRESQFDGIRGERGQYEYAAKEDATAGIYVEGTGNRIRNCYLKPGWGMGVHFRAGAQNTVENCLIEDFNWLIKQDGAAVQLCGIGNRVIGCTIRHCSGMGIVGTQIGDSFVRGFEVLNNHVSDTGLVLLDSGNSAIYFNNHNAKDRGCQNAVIAYNEIGTVHTHWDNGKGMGIYMDDGNDHLTIHHNLIHAGPNIRWPIFSNGGPHVVENFRVYHNTVWDMPDAANAAGFVSSIRPKSIGRRESVDVRNNVAQFTAYRGLHGKDSEATTAANISNAKPTEFADVAAGNFQPRAESTLIDAGEVIPGFTKDVIGKAPDIGAFEHGAPQWKAGSTLTGDPTQK
jgi:hypothetical protein